MEIINCDQRTPEWYEARDLKMTGSEAKRIKPNGKGLVTLVNELIFAHELFTKYGVREDKPSSWQMNRGIELEPEAISLYELENNIQVTQVGFVIQNDYVGCSPDGLINDDGGIEIKSRGAKLHYDYLETGILKPEEIAQIQMCMMVCEREWWDFVSYHPDFGLKSLYQQRLYPDYEIWEQLGRGLETGTELLKEYRGE